MGILAGFSLIILWLAYATGQDAVTTQATSDRVGTLGSRGAEAPSAEKEALAAERKESL
jgi:hypothetical protein